MKESVVGKTLLDEKDTEYIVTSELSYKGIPCVYAKKTSDEEKTDFFQIVDNKLVSIESKKMKKELTDIYLDKEKNEVPRSIKKGESIEDYFKFLDGFYKTKIISKM